MKNPKNYEVGYGKPPKDTRFKKGKSGNPSGRPKGRNQNLKAILNKVLAKRVTVTDRDGRQRKVSFLEGAVNKFANLATTDPKSFKTLMQLYLQLNGKELIEEEKAPLPWSDDDGQVEPKITA